MADIAELGLRADSRELKQATTDLDRLGRAAGRTETSTERMERAWSIARKTMLAVTAAVTASTVALVKMTQAAAKEADEFAKMSQSVGVSVESLSQLKHAAELSGTSMSALGRSLALLSRRASDAQHGLAEASRSFEDLGVSVEGTDGKLKNTEQLMLELADVFARMEDGPKKTALAMEVFGRSGAALIPMLNQGSAGIREMMDEAEQLGATFSGDTARAAEQYNDNLTRLSAAMTGLRNEMFQRLIPILVDITESMVRSAKEGNGLIAFARGAITAIEGLARALIFLAKHLDTILVTLGTFVGVKGLTAIIALAPGVVGGVTAMAAAFGRLAVSVSLALGPAGWIALAAGAMYAFVKAQDDGTASSDTLRRALVTLQQAKEGDIEGSLMAARAARDEAKARLDTARAALAEVAALAERAAQMRAGGGLREGGFDAGTYVAAIEAAERARVLGVEIATLDETIEQSNAVIAEGEARFDAYKNRMADTERTVRMTAEELKKQQDAADAAAKALKDYFDRLERISKAGLEFTTRMRNMAAQLAGPLAVALDKHNRALEEIHMLHQMGAISSEVAAEAIRLFGQELDNTVDELDKNGEKAKWLQSILEDFENTGMRGLIREIERVGEALEEAFDNPEMYEALQAYLVRLQEQMGSMRTEGLEKMVGASQQVLSSMQSMAKEGSNAYKAMEVASRALNVVLAIGAVMNQGKGDPYTAFARMAAMAAAVAGLVGSIGSFGGGFTNTAEQRQQTQGTGTVLGDAEAKSDSLARAMDITADATSKLVGINTGMLRALTALQSALSSAGGMLARGAGQSEFSALPAAGRFGGPLSGILDPFNLLGGSSRVTDQGIVIMGGALTDMMENIMVGAFQEVQTRRWRFGSRRTSEEVVPVADELAAQFELVIASIVDTVREGALALGMLPAEVEAALAAFRVEEIRISTMDLSAEEAQAELAAVFSAIFDGLAGDVVPFIAQFQRVGEGLGETLVRVATGVQVTQEAIRRLGFTLDETDPETFAQISEGLIDLMGGIDEFITGMSSFVSRFASEEVQFAIAQDDITRAFAQFGLVVPETRDGMWELMQSLDASTEAGREQIAMLLRLTDAADAYYNGLDRQEQALQRLRDALMDYATMVQSIEEQLATFGMSDFNRNLFSAHTEFRRMVDALNASARAAGLTQARTQDLTRAQELYARRVAQLVAQLIQSGQQLANQLGLTPLSAIEAEIARIQSETTSSMSSIGQAFQDATAQAQSFADALLIGDLSPLGSAERLAEAIRQFNQAQSLAERQRIGEQVLRIGRERFASGEAYARLFDQIQGGLRGFSEPASQAQEIGQEVSGALSALFRERDALIAEQAERDRIFQANQLAQIVADLAQAQGITFAEAFEQLGVLPEELAAILGLDEDGLEEFLSSLEQDAVSTADAVYDSANLIVDALFELPSLIADAIHTAPERLELPTTSESAEGQREANRRLGAIEEAVRDLIDRSSERGVEGNQFAERTANAVETLAFSGGGFSDRTR